MSYAYMVLLGACLGSFLNVVIYRLPRRASVVWPRSRCPRCRKVLRGRHLVPIVSFLLLRGRCASCRAAIPRSVVAVEAGTAALCAGLFHVFGWSVLLLRFGALALVLIAAAEIDRRHGIIPDRLMAVAAGSGFLLLLAAGPGEAVLMPMAAVSAGGLLWGIRIVSRWVTGSPGLGMGDVKLAAVLGLYLGWYALWALYLAVVLGGVFGVAGRLAGRLPRFSRVPFAPFVAAGTGLYLFGVSPIFSMTI